MRSYNLTETLSAGYGACSRAGMRFTELLPRDDKTGLVNVVVDTPRGSRHKYKIDEKSDALKLSRRLTDTWPTARSITVLSAVLEAVSGGHR